MVIKTSISTGQLKAAGVSEINKHYAHFIGVLAHERQHANYEVPAGGANDPDGDNLSNTFESLISFTDPNDNISASKDAVSLYINGELDSEVYAGGPVEENAIKAADTSQDWANPGTNHSP